MILPFLLVLIPFVSTNLTYDPTIIKTTFIKAGLITILGIYLISSLKHRKIKIRKISPVFFLTLLAAYVILNFIFKYQFASSEKLFTTLLFFCFFFALAHISITPRFIRLIIWQFFIITSLIGLSSLIYYFIHRMAPPTHFQRTNLFFYNPNFLAGYFVFSIPLSLCLLHERYKKHLASKQLTKIDLLLYLLTLIQIGGFITTLSRAGSLGFSASILFLIFLKSSKKIWRHVSIFLLITILCGCVLVMSMPHTFTHLIGIRSTIWQGTHKMIKENLLTGTGVGSFSKVYPSFRPPGYFLFRDAAPVTVHSHNELLEIWAELGIIGLLLWCGFLMSLFYFVLKKMDSSNSLFIHGALSGIVGLFIQNMFSVSLRIPFINFYLWIGLGMSMALIKDKNFGQAPFQMLPQAKKLILAFLFLTLIIWTSVKFIVFPFLGDFYFGRGYLERRKGNLSQAISYYSKAINFSPQPRDIYYKRAFILGKTGREKDALNDYLKIEKISPGYARIYRNLGITYLSLGEIDKAIENLNKAIAANPYDSHAHKSLGVAYGKMRR